MQRFKTCLICKQALDGGEKKLFCEKHFAEYQIRRQTGIVAEELNPFWLDTLDIWRDRPAALQVEQNPELFQFVQKWEGWRFFMRGQLRRLPDWICIHEQTGELRRFVEVAVLDVRDDLLGVVPAPHQEELQKHWGQPGSHRPSFPDYWDEHNRVRLEILLQHAPMSVYGICDNLYDLQLASLHIGGTNGRMESVTLTFRTGSTKKPRCWLVLSSVAWYLEHRRERYFSELLLKKQDDTMAERVESVIRIAGKVFNTEVTRSSDSQAAYNLTLRGDKAYLTGEAAGFTNEEVMQLLGQLVVVNDRQELIAQYQAELFQPSTT